MVKESRGSGIGVFPNSSPTFNGTAYFSANDGTSGRS